MRLAAIIIVSSVMPDHLVGAKPTCRATENLSMPLSQPTTTGRSFVRVMGRPNEKDCRRTPKEAGDRVVFGCRLLDAGRQLPENGKSEIRSRSDVIVI